MCDAISFALVKLLLLKVYSSLTLYVGQVYYTLLKHREDQGIKDAAISRVEQVSPFPYDMITPHLDKYPNAELFWCQVSNYQILQIKILESS